MKEDLSLSRFQTLLQSQINATFRRGSLVAAGLGLVSACLILVFESLGLGHGLRLPAIWTLICGSYALLLFLAARAEAIKGLNRYLLMLPFVSLPTVLYVMSALQLPAGSATYITGPPSYIYFFLLILTGFAFSFWLSFLCGLLAGSQYLLIYFASRATLALIQTPDPLMYQDMTSFPMYFFKAFAMVFAGTAIGLLANNARHLIVRILDEEHQRQGVERLFGQYVSPEIRDRIIASKLQMAGEKKQMALLFCDIRGFTTISEQHEPEWVVTRLNLFLERMVAAIDARGGVIDKFIGDAILATFGGVIDLDQPCQAAVRAALAMQAAADVLNREWAARGEAIFALGIGIHYGEVLQGPIGSAERREFTVIGDAVNLASRIESQTKDLGQTILISAAVAENLPSAWRERLQALGPVQVKGKARSAELYAVPAELPISDRQKR